MKKNNKIITGAIALFALIMLSGKVNAFNYNTSEMRVYSIANGKKI